MNIAFRNGVGVPGLDRLVQQDNALAKQQNRNPGSGRELLPLIQPVRWIVTLSSDSHTPGKSTMAEDALFVSQKH